MPFIGNQPALSYTSFAKQDFTTSATTSYTLDNPVTNENEIALFINFVRQEPTTAYTASGTSLTLTSATSVSDDMYCVFLGKAVQTVNPPNGSVGTAQIADLAVTSGKLASGVLPDNTPAFFAYLSLDQSVGDSLTVKANIDSEVYDTDSCYDNSTNYRFTPTTSGKYLVSANLEISSTGGLHDIEAGYCYLYKNGSEYARARFDPNADVFAFFAGLSVPVVMNGTTDYLEIYTYVDTTGGTQIIKGISSVARSWFSAIKIIE